MGHTERREGKYMNAKKVWDITSTVLVILAVLFAVLLMGARLLGFRVYNIISGSMEPVYNRGDLVYVQPVKNISQLKVGDVISYVQNEELVVVTHRIVRIDPEQNRVHTKGETNDTEDPPVHFNNVIGVVKFHIPLLGYVSDWVQNPPGMYITVGVGAVLMILVFMPNPFDKKKKGAVAAVEASPAEGTPAEPLPTEEAK